MDKHSTWYYKAKEKYQSGAWSKAMLLVLVEKRIITMEEYVEITEDTNV